MQGPRRGRHVHVCTKQVVTEVNPLFLQFGLHPYKAVMCPQDNEEAAVSWHASATALWWGAGFTCRDLPDAQSLEAIGTTSFQSSTPWIEKSGFQTLEFQQTGPQCFQGVPLEFNSLLEKMKMKSWIFRLLLLYFTAPNSRQQQTSMND